ncbi:hypothetical protein [Natronobacterium texcoconense]|uniref:Uncharacterized protein n=1 Tax=Natronobacterium texcoconense TaxID=1095778 RepID=A0A1H1CEK9_NATTX|nr:hypothetical protein [Natronobacterium texcoconense]SDQ62635.1 hypothetical protein SAMN04489842_1377 [Natronobacterium texcoconense]
MNQKEIEERREELFTRLGSKLTTAHSEWDRLATQLDKYQETVEEIEDRYPNLPEEKRQGFASSLDHIISSLTDTDSPATVLDTKDELKEAYENPLIRSIQESYLELYAELGVELTEDQESEVRGKLRAIAEQHPERTLQETNQLIDQIRELSDPVVQVLRNDIGDAPTEVTSPESLNKYLDTLEERHATLTSLSDQLSRYAWAPKELTAVHTWEPLLHSDKDIEISDLIKEINENVQSTPDIVPLKSTLRSELQNRLEEIRKQPRVVFKDIAKGVSNIAENMNLLAEVQALYDIMDFESENIEFTNTIENWQKEIPESLGQLQQSVQTTTHQVNNWRNTLSDRWHSKQSTLSTYSSILDETLPEKITEHIGEELPVEENIVRSYSVLTQAESWISDREEEILEHLSEDAQRLFYALSEQRMYDISEDELGALEELMDIVNIKVVMNE